MTAQERPNISDIESGDELKRWYWLKAELVAHCQALGLPYTGSKAAICERLATFIDTGKIVKPRPQRNSSTFNWAKETLTPETVITDSYRNGPNVRRFFIEHIGPSFRFTISFMQWMKANTGKTLADAILAWQDLQQAQKAPGFKTTIPASNQFNQYLRDFFAANSDLSMKDARRCWAIKTQGPAPHRYQATDLLFLQQKS